MGVAARAAAFRARMRNHPGPLSAVQGASPAGGVPFIADVLGPNARLIVEAAFGANLSAPDTSGWTWTDISGDVIHTSSSGVAISPMGRSDETSSAQPAGCAFTVLNTTGNYTPYFPGSVHYPYVRRNLPIRVRIYTDALGTVTRFIGYAASLTPTWDATGNLALVNVSASGILRRLQQGSQPLRSPIYRAITGATSTPLAYWPLEDDAKSVSGASAVSSVAAMTVPSGAVKFGNATGPAGSASVVATAGGKLYGYTDVTNFVLSNRVEMAFHFGSAVGATPVTVMHLTQYRNSAVTLANINAHSWTQFAAEWYVQYDSTNGLRAFHSYNNGTTTSPSFHAGTLDDGNWHWLRHEIVQTNTTDLTWSIYVDNALVLTGVSSTTPVGPISAVTINEELSSVGPDVGHVVIWSPYNSTADTYGAFGGYAGESLTARFSRLCTEQDVPTSITGTSSLRLDTQPEDTFANLIADCETTEDGVITDGMDTGLTFATRAARYNITPALTLDASAGHITPPFEPVDDDQRNVNSASVQRSGGSTNTFTDATGSLGTQPIGTYDKSITVHSASDSDNLYHAAWIVRKGTVEGFRLPRLHVDLRANPSLVNGWLSAGLGSRIDVTNIATVVSQYGTDTLSLLVEGYDETLSPLVWDVQLACSAYEPYRVAVLQSSVSDFAWRLDSGASTLGNNYPAGSTSLTVIVTDGYLWSTVAGDYPRDVSVGGVRVTVTSVSGSSSPQTFAVSPTSAPLAAGWTVALWKPPRLAW